MAIGHLFFVFGFLFRGARVNGPLCLFVYNHLEIPGIFFLEGV